MAPDQGSWTPPAWTLGDRLRKAREAAGLSQIRELADRSGIAGNSIGPWELGKRTPSPATLAQVVRVLAPLLGAPEDALTDWLRRGA